MKMTLTIIALAATIYFTVWIARRYHEWYMLRKRYGGTRDIIAAETSANLNDATRLFKR